MNKDTATGNSGNPIQDGSVRMAPYAIILATLALLEGLGVITLDTLTVIAAFAGAVYLPAWAIFDALRKSRQG